MESYDRKIRALPEVIRALEECDGGGDKCAACAYNDVGDGCGNIVEMDALFWLKELSTRLDLGKNGRLELGRRCRELEEKLERTEAELADRRKDVEVLTEAVKQAEVVIDRLLNKLVDSEPVVHAHWITEMDDLGWLKHGCSNCAYTKRTDIHVRLGWDFCPYCGAHMDEEVKDVSPNL